MLRRVPSLGRGGGLHSNQGGGGHLSAGHAINTVVDKNNGDIFAPVCSAHALRQTDGSKVAVALIGEHQGIRIAALDAGCNGAGTSVGGGNVVISNVIHLQAAAANTQAAQCLIDQAHFVQDLTDELHNRAVHTAGTKAGDLVLLDRLCTGIDLFHLYLPSKIELTASMTFSRLIILPPEQRQV